MSKQKFTPGPWIELPNMWVGTEDHRRVAKVYDYSTVECGGPYLESNANVQLIAAAPELLEALKGMISLIDSGYLVRNILHDDTPDWELRQLGPVSKLKQAIDAIKKAEGTND